MSKIYLSPMMASQHLRWSKNCLLAGTEGKPNQFVSWIGKSECEQMTNGKNSFVLAERMPSQ
ncbi:MAG: hypothetical protein AAFN77_22380 [Planctomycetota bacterium]